VLREAGIQAEYREDIKTVVWEKYLFISPVANATTYLGKTFGELLRSEESMKLLDGLLDELERVARDQGVRLPQEIHRMSLERISSFPPETKSSMQLDFERGAKTELEALTGYVVRYARDHGMAVPTYGEVYEWLLRRGETRE
jgi:2-dehydropantoate 2-reductase